MAASQTSALRLATTRRNTCTNVSGSCAPGTIHLLSNTNVGTAVISKTEPGRARRPDGAPFTSHLDVQDFYTLLQTGHVPVEFVMGVCVWHVAAQGFMQTLRQIGQNIEMPQWTQGYYDARETALSRMQAEAERVRATGITGVEWAASEWMWGTHTLEFFTSGTAVRKVGEPDGFDPGFVLPLR